MKIVIPMAGRGSRFADRGYNVPKPLIQVAGEPMIIWALRGLECVPRSEIIFIVLAEHEKQYRIRRLLSTYLDEPFEVISIPDVTEGQLCTVMAALNEINTTEDVLVAASDSYIKSDIAKDIASKSDDCVGLISVCDLPGDRWSFAKTDDDGKVLEVAEKKRISKHASTGLYYFSRGHQLVSIAKKIIDDQEKTRGEYYVIPVYQKMINAGLIVELSQAKEMWDMGTPEAKQEFEKHLGQNEQ